MAFYHSSACGEVSATFRTSAVFAPSEPNILYIIPMKIDHIAIWVQNIEKVCEFYQKYFNATIGPLYHNPTKGFTSRFITFEGGARIEVMHRTDVESSIFYPHFGWCHVAISLGSKENVDKLTAQMEAEGITVVGKPRTTGDGYYESVVRDPEGNLIELTV